MAGERIDLAKQSLKLFIASLSSGSNFNICSFSENFKFLFPDTRSVEINPQNRLRA